MPELKQYRLFASHAWHRSEDYVRIFEFLDAARYFDYANYSVPVSRAFDGLNTNQLREQLKSQIRPVQCVIILAGMYVSYSEWINFEIEFANSLNKPIIGVKPWGSERIPAAVQYSASKIVGWNTNSIVDAIREYAI